MTKLKYLFILFFAAIIQLSFAQDQQEFEHVINSKIFDKERKVKVFLPKRYLRDSISKFAVTYVLDAQHQIFWDIVKGNSSYMIDNYSVMPMIIVGVVSDNRGSEFNPKSDKLRQHINDEIFPLIEKNYRIDNFRAIVGHSWGGAFVGNTIFSEHRDMFNAYIGISPSFGDKENIIEKHADSLLKSKISFKKYLYLSHGDVGRRELEFSGYVNNIDSLIKAYPNKTLAWQPRHIKDVGHWQIVGPSYCDGLLSMSRNYFADQKIIEGFTKNKNEKIKKLVAEFNANKLNNFEYSHKASANYFNFVANDFKAMKDYQNAIEIYEMALEIDQENLRVYGNLADIYDEIKNVTLARKTFLKVKSLLEAQKANLSANYYNNMTEWVGEKLESYKN